MLASEVLVVDGYRQRPIRPDDVLILLSYRAHDIDYAAIGQRCQPR